MDRIFELNFPPLLQKVKILLDKWNQGFHSWIGRCNIIKMNILPKILYLLQTLPIHIPVKYLKQCQRVIFEFIWAHKNPRIQRKQLMNTKRQGGLGVPDIRKYYYATHLNRLIDWNRHSDTKLWVQIEQAQYKNTP